MRKFLIVLCLTAVFSLTAFAHAQSGNVLVLEISGPVTPTMASYFERGIQEAEAQSANALVILLDTPGGEVTTTLDIASTLSNAKIPVIVYVYPEGGMAASAGAVITLSAHAAGMAPDTIIGATSPINSDGTDLSETAFRKATQALAATMRGFTENRSEEAQDMAVLMVTEAAALNEKEALEIGLIDAIAVDTTDLLNQLDGMAVQINGETETLQTANAVQQPFRMTFIELVLHSVANPIIIGILMAIGVQALIAEVSNPGGWVAGVIGVILIGLGLYGMGQLPVNWLGIGLIIIAMILFIAELFTPTHGALSIAGALCLLGGLLVLFNSPGSPDFSRIPIPAAVSIAGGTALIFIFIIGKAFNAQRILPQTGSESMVGKIGPVRQSFAATKGEGIYHGTVLVNGELWQARSEEAIPFGTDVIVKQVDGVRLVVAKADHE